MDPTAVVLSLLILVTLLVVGPLLYEMILSVLSAIGFRNIRHSARSMRIAHLLNEVSDRAERGIQAMVLGMIFVPIYVHFQEIVPLFTGSPHHVGEEEETASHIIFVHLLPSLWINSNVLYNYYKACSDSAGKVDVGIADPSKQCARCRQPKPAHVHHCSTCGVCVPDMDHHCPFTANCVGRGNYPRFFLFVMHAWIATAYALWLAVQAHHICHPGRSERVCLQWKSRLYYLSLVSFLVMTAFLLMVVALTMSGRTFRGFLSGGGPDILPRRSPLQRLLIRVRLPRWWMYVLPWSVTVPDSVTSSRPAGRTA